MMHVARALTLGLCVIVLVGAAMSLPLAGRGRNNVAPSRPPTNLGRVGGADGGWVILPTGNTSRAGTPQPPRRGRR